jgi:hypothetical protein
MSVVGGEHNCRECCRAIRKASSKLTRYLRAKDVVEGCTGEASIHESTALLGRNYVSSASKAVLLDDTSVDFMFGSRIVFG